MRTAVGVASSPWQSVRSERPLMRCTHQSSNDHDGRDAERGGTVCCWNARTGEPVGKPLETQAELYRITLRSIDDTPIIEARTGSGIIIRWNARTGELIGTSIDEYACLFDTYNLYALPSYLELIIGEPITTTEAKDNMIAVGSGRGVVVLEVHTTL